MEYNLNSLNPNVLYSSLVNEKNCPAPKVKYSRRKVKWYEIEFIMWGEGHILTDGISLPATKGSIFFRKPGMVVQGIAPYHCFLIVYDPFYNENKIAVYKDPNFLDALSSPDYFIENADSLEFPTLYHTKQFSKLEELFANCYNEFLFNKTHMQFYLKAFLMQILTLTHIEITKENFASGGKLSSFRNYQRVMSIKEYIEENSTSNIKLKDLALITKLSPNFLCKIFKDVTQETISAYIHKCKIVQAKKLILQSELSMKQIAFSCGFESDTYFFYLFKRYEGMTPSEFKGRFRLYV